MPLKGGRLTKRFLILTAAMLLLVGCGYRETVPRAVLHDHMGVYSDVTDANRGAVWTTEEVAAEEFALMEQGLGIPTPAFTLRIRYLFRHQGMLSCKAAGDKLTCEMTLLPVYSSESAARATASHEVSHLYAGALLGDWTEGTAWTMAACYGSAEAREWIGQWVGTRPTTVTCTSLQERLQNAKEEG